MKKTVYYGGNFFIVKDGNNFYFEDDASVCLLKNKINNPEDIVWDECRGWIFKNGKDLPWEE